MEQQADRDLLIQERMQNLFLFSLLVRDQKSLARLVRHQDRAGLGLLKSFSLDLLSIDQGKRQPVRQKRPEFLHQIEGEAGPAGPVPMKEAHRRVESHRFQSRTDIVNEERVYEREQCIDVIQRRPAVSFLERKILLLGHDQMVENAEIDMGGVPLAAAESVERLILIEQIEIVAQALHGERNLIHGHLIRMVPERPLEDRPVIGYLSGEDRTGDVCGSLGVIGLPVLLPAEEDVPGDRPLDTRQETAMLREEADADTVLRTEAHQEGAARHVPKTDNTANRMDGKAEADILLHFDDDRLPLLSEVGTLRRDKQGVQVFFHVGYLFPFDKSGAFW